MTKQEIFDTVVSHLRTQGCKALCAGNCVYRGPNGTKCAMGALIPDELYAERMEGMSAGMVLESYPELEKLLGGDRASDNGRLLTALQETHDNWDPSDWESRFEYQANKHNLVYTKENT